jgi:soluble lytic murein transglycosylase-like protein
MIGAAAVALKRWGAALLLAAGLLPVAQAEVWGFVDAKGVAHFASEKMDERYELFYRGGESFDTSRALPTPRAVAVPTAAHKLIAYFEISPSFKQVKHHLREASRAQDVDYELLKALIATESGFDPRAVSPKGAVGLMQIMPATAERYGLVGDHKTPIAKKLTDPRTNIKTGVRYLRYLIDLFPGRLDLALAAYNAGEGAVQRAGNKVPNFRETQNYVKTVMQLYGVLKPPSMSSGGHKGRLPGRIRVELPAPPTAGVYAPAMTMGGAANRGNLPSQPSQPSRPSQPSTISMLPAASVAAATQIEFRTERD